MTQAEIDAFEAAQEPARSHLEHSATDALKTELVARVSARVDDLDSLDKIKAVGGIYPMLNWTQASTAQTEARDLAIWAKRRLKDVSGLTTDQLKAFDATAADPFGDGDGWPS
jgi:predicted lysophospholipase L1 biosynthesis ABC-type transport system permease subunit